MLWWSEKGRLDCGEGEGGLYGQRRVGRWWRWRRGWDRLRKIPRGILYMKDMESIGEPGPPGGPKLTCAV